MSGRGKGGKGFKNISMSVGKGGGKMGYGSQRRLHTIRDPLLGISKAGVRKLARRGGVKRVSGSIYGAVRSLSMDFLTAILRDAIALTDYTNKKTVTTRDIVEILARHGRSIYI